MDYDDRSEKWMPYPELLIDEPEAYQIIDSNMPGMPTRGMTDKVKRVMWVPCNRQGRPVSLHEVAHAVWSPAKLDRRRLRAPVLLVQAVEDGRINIGLREADLRLTFDAELTAAVMQLAAEDLARGDVFALVSRSVASFGTALEPLLRALVAESRAPGAALAHTLIPETYARLERARKRRRDFVASFGQGVRVARWLARALERHGISVSRRASGLVCCAGRMGHGRGSGRGRHGRPGSGDGILDGVHPGRLLVATPRLPIRCAPAMSPVRARRRAAAEGVLLRHLHRFVDDQCVFDRPATTRAARGGSVLVDVSGSMQFSARDIDRIIIDAPEATLVAIYSGREEEGELRIVVRHGFRAAPSDLEAYGSGNVVDFPALRWLARQPGPRVWISDGRATGCDDIPTDAITHACRALCRRHGIVRVRTAKAAARVLAGLPARSPRQDPNADAEEGRNATDAAQRAS